MSILSNLRTYSGMLEFSTFEDRFNYLALDGTIADDTLGFMRYLAQQFYASPDWKRIRDQVIIRDNGCDLGIEGRELFEAITVHHINPLTLEDLQKGSPLLFDPENLICVSDKTHKAIHYGDKSLLLLDFVERRPNDTCPWK